MSIYMSRLFPKCNSSFLLSGGNALRSKVVRLREETCLVDSGVGSPRICMEDELTRVPTNRAITRFENKVGYLASVAAESPINNRRFQMYFMDVVAGDPLVKERAAARLNDLVGSADVVPGEPLLLLPRKYRHTRARVELNKIWQNHGKVKGFVVERARGGYAIAIGGYIALMKYRPLQGQRLRSDLFSIETANPKGRSIVVW